MSNAEKLKETSGWVVLLKVDTGRRREMAFLPRGVKPFWSFLSYSSVAKPVGRDPHLWLPDLHMG